MPRRLRRLLHRAVDFLHVSVGESCKDAAGKVNRRDGDILKPIGEIRAGRSG